MDDARKKLRVCLICIVAVAIIFGVIYYFNDIKEQSSVSEGTLVMNETDASDKCCISEWADIEGGTGNIAELEGRG